MIFTVESPAKNDNRQDANLRSPDCMTHLAHHEDTPSPDEPHRGPALAYSKPEELMLKRAPVRGAEVTSKTLSLALKAYCTVSKLGSTQSLFD